MDSKEYDFIHPNHYKDKLQGKECIDIMIELYGIQAVALWCELTAFKYKFRCGSKPGCSQDEDILKQRWYERAHEKLCEMMRIQESIKGELTDDEG